MRTIHAGLSLRLASASDPRNSGAYALRFVPPPQRQICWRLRVRPGRDPHLRGRRRGCRQTFLGRRSLTATGTQSRQTKGYTAPRLSDRIERRRESPQWPSTGLAVE